MIQDHAAAAVVIAIIAEKNKSRKKRRKKTNLGENLALNLGLQDEYNYNILFTNDFWKLWRKKKLFSW